MHPSLLLIWYLLMKRTPNFSANAPFLDTNMVYFDEKDSKIFCKAFGSSSYYIVAKIGCQCQTTVLRRLCHGTADISKDKGANAKSSVVAYFMFVNYWNVSAVKVEIANMVTCREVIFACAQYNSAKFFCFFFSWFKRCYFSLLIL